MFCDLNRKGNLVFYERRKARNPDQKGSSGCRSGVLMHRYLLSFAVLTAAFSTQAFAQTQIAFRQADAAAVARLAAAPAITENDPISRPRVVEEKSAAVKSVVAVNIANVERIAFDLVNKKRSELGLQPLAWSEGLSNVARGHSQEMADQKYFSHRGADGKMVSDRADRAGLGRWRSIGENIAFNRGYDDPVIKAVELWLGSPSHRQNMLDGGWRESAIGVAVSADGAFYFTQVFLKK